MAKLIVIISEEFIPTKHFDDINFLIIRNNYTLIDHQHLLLNDKLIFFDYLIIDNIKDGKKLELLIDDNFIITNAFLETTIQGVFAFGNSVLNLKPKDEQLELILDYIKNPW